MGITSDIEWTESTWTPIRARVRSDAREIAVAKGYTDLLPVIQPGRVGPHCEKVSPGCGNCYSEENNGRCLPHNGTGLPFTRRARDLVEMFVDYQILAQPLSWKRPRQVFVCSQTDLFGEFVPDTFIDRVFALMYEAQWHTFQMLTKRPERMRDYVGGPGRLEAIATLVWQMLLAKEPQKAELVRPQDILDDLAAVWPLRNAWLGVSVENQETSDKRRLPLLHTPAAVRWVSYEPALGCKLQVVGLDSLVRSGEWLDGIETLRGWDLACWCSLDNLCHADALLEVANA